MTWTLPGADIHGYYAALGIELPPAMGRTDVPVRCVFDPAAHQRADHKPSLSISLVNGAYCCHGCGAKGGARDAAEHFGHSIRSARQLLARYGLAQPLDSDARPPARTAYRAPVVDSRPAPTAQPRRRLNVSERQLQRWHLQLLGRVDVLERLHATRGWSGAAVRQLQLGLDRDQIMIPVRQHGGGLVALLRYRPNPQPGQNKIRALAGSRRALFPHPADERSRHLLLVEGEPDAIAARSHGLPAIALPGVDGWRAAWAPLFAGKAVTVVMDADRHGRACARQVADDLAEHATAIEVVDLAPDRADGYDLTDWLMANRHQRPHAHKQLHHADALNAA
jgi:hypothetical protein